MDAFINLKDVTGSILFSLLGLILFTIAFVVFDRITPGNLWKEILETQNTAAAIVVAALVIGISIIVGMSIHG